MAPAAMSHPLAPLDAGAVFHGRYEVVRCIAQGGMGAVYEVVDRDTKRRRALKVMLPGVDDDGEMRARFLREATIAAEVESEHLAETIDAGTDEASGAPFLVMELLVGEDLGQILERGPLPAEQIVTYLWQASLALDKTHAAGVVHRDLKPENLFVTCRDDGTPCVKLLDFGIAKVVDGKGSLAMSTQGVVGTPLYSAPEQVHGRVRVSAQTDVYALAQIAYALLSGEPYWSPEQETAAGIYPILMAVVDGPPQRASVRALERTGVELPNSFDVWFERATAAQPGDRFGSCAELVDALAEALDTGQPATATMSSLPPDDSLTGQGDMPPTTRSRGGDSRAETGEAVTATLPGLARAGRWPTALAGLVMLAVLIWGLSRWLGEDPTPASPGPAAAGSATLAPARTTIPSSTAADPAASGSSSPAPSTAPSASAAASAVPSAAKVVPVAPRPTVPTPTPPAKPTTTGWTPPVTER